MWIFTTSGFFSCVQDKQDPRQIQMRARSKQDIEAIEAIMKQRGLEFTGPFETPKADYRYRVVMPRPIFLAVMVEIAGDLNYTNFKDAAHRSGQGDKPLMRVWSVMAEYQDRLVREAMENLARVKRGGRKPKKHLEDLF